MGSFQRIVLWVLSVGSTSVEQLLLVIASDLVSDVMHL